MNSPVAVIDIGSNTIKALVARRLPDGGFESLHFHAKDARLGTGIGRAEPGLSEDAMHHGLHAIKELLDDVAPFSPARTTLVATSAVRSASNGAEFCRRVLEKTGHAVRVLTGDEEARLIGEGLCCDPALRDTQDFYVFDLGGGSLECLAFRARQMEQATSLLLGCVRLTEHFVGDVSKPIPERALEAVARHVHEMLRQNGFRFNLPPTAVPIGTGGTLTAARTIGGARTETPSEHVDTWLTLEALRELRNTSARLNLEDRKRLPGMPGSRADVFPVAVATLVALAEYGGLSGFRHSAFSLRWGVAAELLGEVPSPIV